MTAGDELSGSQLDKLGDRLRAGPLTLANLRQLRRFLDTLEPFAEETFAKIRDLDTESAGVLPAQVTRRNVKTIRSIVAKLRRQTTSLRQIQDLVGCRVVVEDIVDQHDWERALVCLFPSAQVIDRRAAPQHGYRAIHVIVRSDLQRFEVQLRTRDQDWWANVVESLANRVGNELKYGGGPPLVRSALAKIAAHIQEMEAFGEEWQPRPDSPSELGTIHMRLRPHFASTGLPKSEGGRQVFPMKLDGAEIWSTQPIRAGSNVLIGRPESSPRIRAQVGEVLAELTADDLVKFAEAYAEVGHRVFPGKYWYRLLLEGGQKEDYHDMFERTEDLGEMINSTLASIESELV